MKNKAKSKTDTFSRVCNIVFWTAATALAVIVIYGLHHAWTGEAFIKAHEVIH